MCIRYIYYLSIISYNATNISHNHHTDISLLKLFKTGSGKVKGSSGKGEKEETNVGTGVGGRSRSATAEEVNMTGTGMSPDLHKKHANDPNW